MDRHYNWDTMPNDGHREQRELYFNMLDIAITSNDLRLAAELIRSSFCSLKAFNTDESCEHWSYHTMGKATLKWIIKKALEDGAEIALCTATSLLELHNTHYK